MNGKEGAAQAGLQLIRVQPALVRYGSVRGIFVHKGAGRDEAVQCGEVESAPGANEDAIGSLAAAHTVPQPAQVGLVPPLPASARPPRGTVGTMPRVEKSGATCSMRQNVRRRSKTMERRATRPPYYCKAGDPVPLRPPGRAEVMAALSNASGLLVSTAPFGATGLRLRGLIKVCRSEESEVLPMVGRGGLTHLLAEVRADPPRAYMTPLYRSVLGTENMRN